MTTSTAPVPTLAHDDVRLLTLMSRGLSIDVIGRRLNMSDRTVRRRTRAICDRLGVRTSIEAVVWAARRGLL